MVVGRVITKKKGVYDLVIILVYLALGMETFYYKLLGVTASLMLVKDDADAVELANILQFGLSSGVFTRE